jgi:hypothetical protein
VEIDLVKVVSKLNPNGDAFPFNVILTGIESLNIILGISHFKESIKTFMLNS